MEEYAGRVLADRYRLPLPPTDEFEQSEIRAFDTYSGQEVLVRQVPLPEVVEAEVLDANGLPDGFVARDGRARGAAARSAATRRPSDPAVRRAIEAAQAAASIPDHPRLDQVFDVFAQGGSLWIVSELVPARSLESLLAEKPLTPYRAAEVAADVLMALRVLHAHGWVHRNITERTVLVCDDGRVMLTGLAAGAAEEALCGYDPVPGRDAPGTGGTAGAPEDAKAVGGAGTAVGAAAGGGGYGVVGGTFAGDVEAARRAAIEARTGMGSAGGSGGYGQSPGSPAGGPGVVRPQGLTGGRAGGPERVVGGYGVPGGTFAGDSTVDPEAARRAAIEARADGGMPGAGAPGGRPGGGYGVAGGTFAGDAAADAEAARRAAIEARAGGGVPGVEGSNGGAAGGERRALETGGDIRAARAGAIAAYRAGARAAARVQEAEQSGRAALPGARPSIEAGGDTAGGAYGTGVERVPATPPPGQIADPYGVRTTTAWNGAAAPAPGDAGQGRTALPTGRSDAMPGRGADSVPQQPTGPLTHGHPQDQPQPADRVPDQPTGRWGGTAVADVPRRGPTTALAAERARQARMAVVGAVTERWAPEQAGPVHENWQLAPPIGPATDLWALGALLFRAVQGHAPYPEESTAELVQLVCAEPPAFAEECGPLRPVVESLLRQDPTERLDFEELNGWLRSLVRSAPEPEAGAHLVAAPPTDPRRLPIVRRRGELVRRRRAGLPATGPHGRHKRGRQEQKAPRKLGRNLLLLILLALAAAIAYAMFFMPKAKSDGAQDGQRTGSAGDVSAAPEQSADNPDASSEPRPEQTSPSSGKGNSSSPSAGSTGTSGSSDGATAGPGAAAGFTVRADPEGFRIAVANGWDRTGKNGRGQVVYSHGSFQLIVVPGRDTTKADGADPMAYQREREYELQPFRDSTWATSSGMRTIEVGGRTMAEGQFTWQNSSGSEVFVRNLAIIVDGRYHVVQVRGPEAERDEVTRLYEQASATYQFTG
ncbi:protein kinase [Streptomyces sp. ME02-8801-2C]|uniref:protein kinase domain-containing protein n=1 Tax=Streptomyces sp. ME02-8801-2C TaxID=3028680 RepID=UPI0029A59110|nr:protein kinase [Streptomyces sp. ME02-8801-2C]MDX3457854.1 protein kinase [Streptomyces sp. ME02-8801-2C]